MDFFPAWNRRADEWPLENGGPERFKNLGLTMGWRLIDLLSYGVHDEGNLPRRGVMEKSLIDLLSYGVHDEGNLPRRGVMEKKMGRGFLLGVYRLEKPLEGLAGGHLWSAIDTSKNRAVALRFLPRHLVEDEDRRAQLRQEAQVMIALEHPGVVPIDTVEEADGFWFATMELVEGTFLGGLIPATGMEPDRFLDVAMELTETLAAAHERGIVHRDLKPSDIVVDGEGGIRILGCGLADLEFDSGTREPSGKDPLAASLGQGLQEQISRLAQPNCPREQLLLDSLSSWGVSVSQALECKAESLFESASYMAPEQLRGRPADARSDVFALGVVLYQMATGHHPFEGETTAHCLTTVLEKTPPPVSELNPKLPKGLDPLISRCLEKKSWKRPWSAFEVLEELAVLPRAGRMKKNRQTRRSRGKGSGGAGPGGTGKISHGLTESEARAVRRSETTATVVRLGVAMAVAAACGWFLWTGFREAVSNTDGEKTGFRPLFVLSASIPERPRITPDGRFIVYDSWTAGAHDLFRLPIGRGQPLNLTRTLPGIQASGSVSPDGRQVAFYSSGDAAHWWEGALYAMPLELEQPKKLTSAPAWHPSWSPTGQEIAFSTGMSDPEGFAFIPSSSRVEAVNLQNGKTRVLAKNGLEPDWSPHGQRIAYWLRNRKTGTAEIWTVSSMGKNARRLPLAGFSAVWRPIWSHGGRYLYFSGIRSVGKLATTIWRMAIDEKTGRIESGPKPVRLKGYALSPSFSRGGRRMVSLVRQKSNRLKRLGIDLGREAVMGTPTGLYPGDKRLDIVDVELSPAGQHLALTRYNAKRAHFSIQVRGLRGKVAASIPGAGYPAWAPDGSKLAFVANRDGQLALWVVKANGASFDKLTESTAPIPEWGYQSSLLWSPDGEEIAYSVDHRGTVLLNVERRIHRFLPLTGLGQFYAEDWSRDGKHILGWVRANGGPMAGGWGPDAWFLYEVETGRYRRLDFGSLGAIVRPRWLPDGKRLIFFVPTGAKSAVLTIWNLLENKGTEVFSVPFAAPREIEVSLDGRFLYFCYAETKTNLSITEIKPPTAVKKRRARAWAPGKRKKQKRTRPRAT